MATPTTQLRERTSQHIDNSKETAMRRTVALTVAGIVAAAPGLGLVVAHASQAAPQHAVVADDKGRHAEPGDDNGRHAEPRDDNGRHAQPGDDNGRHAEPGDDNGRDHEARHHHRHGGRH
jgi:hypothetical protein